MEALRVEGLSKYFGGVRALQNVSFTVKVGERVAIIGPNGAGKTTLFNVLTGLLPADGKIYFFEREITTLAAHRRAHLGLARSFQLTILFPNLTVQDNLLLSLHGTKRSRFEMFRSTTAYEKLLAKAQGLLGAANLWEKKNLPVKDLSYGEQRKMEIALSLALGPKVLLLDEPGTGLTAEEGADFVSMIFNLGREITVLIVDHDMDMVFGMADRIIVLHYGQVIADGTPEEIQADLRVKEIYMGNEEGIGNAELS